MKKAKIMLTAITVLAVVGGVLAFKAKASTDSVYCTNNPDDACAIEHQGFSTKGDVPVFPQTYCTDAEHSDAHCALATTYVGL